MIQSLLLMPLLLQSTHRLLYLISMSRVRFILRKRTLKPVARLLLVGRVASIAGASSFGIIVEVL